jgi:hypothetical protein
MAEPPSDPKTQYPVINSGDYFTIRIWMREKLAKPRSPDMEARVLVRCGAEKLMDKSIGVGTLPNTTPKHHKGDYGPNHQIHSTADHMMLCELRATLVPKAAALKDQNPADNTSTVTFLLSAKPRNVPQTTSKAKKIHMAASALNDFDVSVADLHLVQSSAVEVPSPLPVDPQTKQPLVESGETFGITLYAREKLAGHKSPEMNARILATCGPDKVLDELRPVGQISKTPQKYQIRQSNLLIKSTSAQAITCDLQVTVVPDNSQLNDQNPADNTARTTFRLVSASSLYQQAGKVSLPFDVAIHDVGLRVPTSYAPLTIDPQTKQPMAQSGASYYVRIPGREKLAEKSPTMKARLTVTCGAQKVLDETSHDSVIFKNQPDLWPWLTGPISMPKLSDQAMTCDLQVTMIPDAQGVTDKNPSNNTARMTFRLLGGKESLKSNPATKQVITPEAERQHR